MKNFTTKDMIDFVKWYDCKDEKWCHNTYEEEFNEWVQFHFCPSCNNEGFVYRDAVSNIKTDCDCKKNKKLTVEQLDKKGVNWKMILKQEGQIANDNNRHKEWWDVFHLIMMCQKAELSELEKWCVLKNRFELTRKDDGDIICELPLPEDVEVEAKRVLSSMHIAKQNKLTREPGEWTDEELINGLKLMAASYRKYLLKPAR